MQNSNAITAFVGVDEGDLDTVTGGVKRAQRKAAAPAHQDGFFGGLYKGVVFDVAGNMGGTKLANQLYGASVTADDRSRAQVAMKEFFVAGNKLPKGAPHLFGTT